MHADSHQLTWPFPTLWTPLIETVCKANAAKRGLPPARKVSSEGNLLFSIWDQKNPKLSGFYYSKYVKGKYDPPIMMEEKFKQSQSDCTPFIAHDESYFIFASLREGGYGWHDL